MRGIVFFSVSFVLFLSLSIYLYISLFIYPSIYLATVAPLWVRLLSSRDPLSAGRTYKVVCQAAGARPPATITWRLGPTRLNTHTDKVRMCKSLSLPPFPSPHPFTHLHSPSPYSTPVTGYSLRSAEGRELSEVGKALESMQAMILYPGFTMSFSLLPRPCLHLLPPSILLVSLFTTPLPSAVTPQAHVFPSRPSTSYQ